MLYCYNCFHEHSAPGPCPRCGYDPAADVGKFPQALPHGSILAGQFITGRVLGQGGFGITYLARDNRSGDRVALKEFLPDTMAGRAAGSLAVTPYSGDRGQQFQYGLDCFLDEAKTLAKFLGNPNIVGVRSYFQENGTAYFTMDYIEGVSLKTLLRERGGRISWGEAVQLLLPVMEALEAVHREGLVHRDVAPDNIYIANGGQVKLLDFGAARYSLGDRSRSLDVVLKPGYAPKEQYVRRGRQGPFTDVYALGACFYAAITGYLPPEALERWDKDEIVLPSVRGVKLPPALEDVLLHALEVDAGDRYQTMTEFRKALLASLPAVKAVPVSEPVPAPPKPKPAPVPKPRAQTPPVPIPLPRPEPVPVPKPKVQAPPIPIPPPKPEPVPVPKPRPQAEPVPIPPPKPVPPPEKKPDTKKKWYPFLGAAAVVVVLLAVLGIAMGGRAPASPTVSDLPDRTEDTPPEPVPAFAPDADVASEITAWLYPLGGWSSEKNVIPLVEAFTAETGIQVNLEWLSYSAGDDEVRTALSTGNTPDLILEGPERLAADWGAKGYMVDLSDMIDVADRSEINPSALAACTSTGGSIYQYPLFITTHCMAVNLDAFNAAGASQYLNLETRTWTTDDFIKAVDALYAHYGSTVGAVCCGGQGGDQGTRALVNNLYGGTFTNTEHTRYTWDDPLNVRALELLKSMDGIDFNPFLIGGDEIDLFYKGTLKMAFCWNITQQINPNNANTGAEKTAAGDSIAFMTFPSQNGTPVLEGGVWGFGIFDNGDQARVNAAKRFIKYMCDSEHTADAVNASNYFAARSAAEGTDLSNIWAGNDIMSEYAKLMPYLGPYHQVTEAWPQARTMWWNMLQEVGDSADIAGVIADYCASANQTDKDVPSVISTDAPEPEQIPESNPEPSPEPEPKPAPLPVTGPESKPEPEPESHETDSQPTAPEVPKESGDVYTGETNIHGEPNGTGIMRYANGDVYTGEWKDGKRSGTGRMEYKDDGCVYDGEWSDDDLSVGTMTYANGDVKDAVWDFLMSEGTVRYANGDVYQGRMWFGRSPIEGTMTYANGDVYTGRWDMWGRYHGSGTLTYANGDVKAGTWNHGELLKAE